MTAQWRDLIIVSYAVDPARLIDRVPRGTTLDCWRGHAMVSIVGFRFLETKVLGAPVPFHQDFEEVNLRFYVRRVAAEEPRPGIVFIRELVPRPIVGGMARLLYREPYLVLPMRSKVCPGPPPDVEYQFQQGGRWSTLEGTAGGEGAPPTAGSLEEFITERHWGYNGEIGKDTLEYRVDHPRWRIWHAGNVRADYNAETLCGSELAKQLKTPISALIAEGSAVTVHWRTQIA